MFIIALSSFSYLLWRYAWEFVAYSFGIIFGFFWFVLTRISLSSFDLCTFSILNWILKCIHFYRRKKEGTKMKSLRKNSQNNNHMSVVCVCNERNISFLNVAASCFAICPESTVYSSNSSTESEQDYIIRIIKWIVEDNGWNAKQYIYT